MAPDPVPGNRERIGIALGAVAVRPFLPRAPGNVGPIVAGRRFAGWLLGPYGPHRWRAMSQCRWTRPASTASPLGRLSDAASRPAAGRRAGAIAPLIDGFYPRRRAGLWRRHVVLPLLQAARSRGGITADSFLGRLRCRTGGARPLFTLPPIWARLLEPAPNGMPARPAGALPPCPARFRC